MFSHRFQSETILSTRGYLAMSGHILGCRKWELLLASSEERPETLLNSLQSIDNTHNKELSSIKCQ